jgi:diguanylate cyclase (GGDEF)-like protein
MRPLHFPDPRRERLFRIFDERHLAPAIRRLALTALAVVLAIAVGDAFQPGPARPFILALRGVMLSSAAALLVSTYRSRRAGRWSSRLAWAAGVFGTAEAALLAVAGSAYRDLHEVGMIFTLALSLAGLRLRFPHAAALAASLDLAFMGSWLVGGVERGDLLVRIALLIGGSAIGVLIAYERDFTRRRHFLEVLALQQKGARLRRLTEQLRNLSLSDELTGLPNRRELEGRLSAALAASTRQHTPTVVAMIDLDQFKQINDRLGHAAGDAVLRRVAAILGRSVRAGDTVCRVGGDEFCVLMPATSLVEAMRVVNRSLARLRSITMSAGPAVGFSAGCAESRPEESIPALLSRADAALYRAKAAGRGRVHGSQPTRALESMAVAS